MSPLPALIVEHDPGTRRLLQALLQRAGFETDAVSHGRDAAILLQHVRYSAAVIDLRLSDLEGTELVARLLALDPTIAERALFLSSSADVVSGHVRREYEGLRLRPKPFDVEELVSYLLAHAVPVEPSCSFTSNFPRLSVLGGAKAGVAARVGNDGALHYLADFGYERGEIESYFPLSVEKPMPLCVAARRGEPVWLASLAMAAAEYPELVPIWREYKSQAVAAAPVMHDGRAVAVLGWTFRDPQPFTSEQRRGLESIGAVVGLPNDQGSGRMATS